MGLSRGGSPRKQEDLSAEPNLREALADPVVQAVMRRDGVTQDALLRLVGAVRARLFPPDDVPPHDAPRHEAVVMPFPRPAAREGERHDHSPDMRAQDLRPPDLRPQDLRPKTRWPFCLAQAGGVPRAKA